MSDHPHSDLLLKISAVGEVPCQRIPKLFFPEDIPDPEVRAHAVNSAQALCETCPIMRECLNYAVTTGQEFGVWGGRLFHPSPPPVRDEHTDKQGNYSDSRRFSRELERTHNRYHTTRLVQVGLYAGAVGLLAGFFVGGAL
jgi:WhiB family redox-sensing transcriptional regulator